MTRIRITDARLNSVFLALFLHQLWREGYFLERCHKWVGQAGINTGELAVTDIPLPDRSIQDRLVAEIECERSLVQANRDLIVRFERKIKERIAKVWGE